MNDTPDTPHGSKKIREAIAYGLGILLTAFVVYTLTTFAVQGLQQLSIFFGLSIALTILRYPVRLKKGPKWRYFAWDMLLVSLALATGLYVFIDYWEFIFRVGIPTNWDIFFSTIAVLITLEATRRVVGWPLLIITGIFLLYTFTGQFLPEPLSHRGYDIARITTTLFMAKNGIFGIALNVMCQFIYLFIAFGSFFGKCGGTEFFIDIASSLFGKLRGGPAKISIAVSGMMGTISGSAVANTVTTGTFTIPLMKRIGFESHVAGAVEATASSGGALMPPVMGAAAFVMAEYLGVPYLEICKAALIPAILYYLAIFSVVHFYSLKAGIVGLPAEEMPKVRAVLAKKWFFIVPLFTLVYMLVVGYSPRVAVLMALPATIVMSWFRRESRLTPKKILDAMSHSADNSVMITSACASAGIVIGVVLLTGMGTKITTLVVSLSAGSLFIALPIIMLTSLIFGMGLPTVVCYVLLAATVAPSLVDLGVPPIAAHLFIFYFGMLCMVTPPVSFAAYAGAALANADPMKTGWSAWTFALAGFLLPYMFVYNNSLLLMGSASSIVLALITSIIGVICLGSGIIGYFIKPSGLLDRILFLSAAFLLIVPGVFTDLGGAACIIAALVIQMKKKAFVASEFATSARRK
jgi:TRAP transporter 4TM/12TM fusion protein